MRRGLAITSLLAVLGCRGEREAPANAAPAPSPVAASGPIGGARPLRVLHVAASGAPAPLVLVLHGYGGDGRDADGWFALAGKGLHVAAPDGTPDATGRRFWNAVDTCCDFEGRGVDDVGYLTALVDEIAARHPVDRKRVYAVGLSNGGSMAMRLACDASERFAAVVSFAGPFHEDPARCTPKVPIAVRHLHGTADRVVPYDGGPIIPGIHPKAKGTLPSARAILERWATLDGCTGEVTDPAVDVDRSVPGPEATIARETGCKADVELWTLHGSGHVPPVGPAFGETTARFLLAHAR